MSCNYFNGRRENRFRKIGVFAWFLAKMQKSNSLRHPPPPTPENDGTTERLNKRVKGIEIIFCIQPQNCMCISCCATTVTFLISGAYNSVKKLHFVERNYQSNRIKANVNNEANQKISGDSHCLIAVKSNGMQKLLFRCSISLIRSFVCSLAWSVYAQVN